MSTEVTVWNSTIEALAGADAWATALVMAVAEDAFLVQDFLVDD